MWPYLRRDLAASTNIWTSTTAASIANGAGDTTRKTETARRHALENYEKDLKAAQALELKLGIGQRWRPQSTEWQSAGKLVAMRKYQRALDILEGLIVSRMFELTKMNRSQTGKSFHEGFLFCLNS
jgi:hypothetical protein